MQEPAYLFRKYKLQGANTSRWGKQNLIWKPTGVILIQVTFFDIEKLQHAWADVCRTEYAYHFPVEAKNLEDDLPGWVRRLTALAQ